MNQSKENHEVIQEDGLYPIRTVCHLTGINPVTLRAWERRYNLIRPIRTPKGHRLYTQKDIEQIRRVLTLLDQGISIGQVSPLLQGNESIPAPTPSEAGAGPNIWTQYQSRMLLAIHAFDERSLEAIYNDALSLYPIDLVTNKLTIPLLQQLGDCWDTRKTGIAEEHFFSVYLRNKIGSRIQHTNLRSNGPCLLVACMPGEQHEIGLLLFVLSAISNGYRCIILGANMPLEQIPAVLEKQRIDAIVLSGSSEQVLAGIKTQLRKLVSSINIPVLVGGCNGEMYKGSIESTGAISIGDEIQPALMKVGEHLKSRL